MKKKIFKSIFAVTLSVLLATTAIIFGITYGYLDKQLYAELEQEAEYVAADVEKSGTEYLNSLADSAMRLTWISSDGKVLFDNKADAAVMENHLGREEVSEALETGVGMSSRYSGTLSERTIYYALKLDDGTVIRVSSTQSSLWTLVLDMMLPVLAVTFAALLLAVALASSLSKKLVKPINGMDLDHPENTKTYEELNPIVLRLSEQNRKITKQMDELRVRQTEFEAITTDMSEGMIIINGRAEVLSCNQSALSMLGLAETPQSLLKPDRGDVFREAVRLSLSGKKYSDTVRVDDVCYSVHASPVLHDGEIEGAVIVILDETEKDEREKLRREFTSNVSHELKTPLTSISGFAELIRNGMADGNDARHFAGNIYREAQRLITLVNDIIRLSQLDGGEIPYDEEKINLYEVASDVMERLENIASSHKINMSLAGERLYVAGNRQILEEMIYNLCDNGIKYNRGGGYVKIKVFENSGKVAVSVKDNGIGIPKASQSRVFERFYRVDKSHSKDIGGTGLGLSIVKHGAAYHKARISLESELGVGTEITLIF